MRVVRTGLMIAGLLVSGAAYAGAPGWTISQSSGKVSVLSTGVAKAALRGGSLNAGDFVTTGSDGRAVLVRGEEYLVVAPNSRLRVADPVKAGGMTQIVEHFGNVIYKIKKMTMPHFAVETPFMAAVVKGTTFSVTVTKKGASVQVVEGKVEVSTRDGGATYMVLPGDIGSVSASAPGSLVVQGRENKTIQSAIPASAAPKVETIAATLGDQAGAPAPAVTVIASAIGEGPVALEGLSGGMVRGDSSLAAVVATSASTFGNGSNAASGSPVTEIAAIKPVVGAAPSEPVMTGAVMPPATQVVTETTATATLPPAPAPVAPIVTAQASPAPVVPAIPAATPALPAIPATPGATPAIPAIPATPAVIIAANAPLTSCAGVPNCNGSTYTGPSNVENGSSCAGVANCNGGVFNVNGNAGSSSGSSSSGSGSSSGTSGNGNGNSGSGNSGSSGNGNSNSGSGSSGSGSSGSNSGTGNGMTMLQYLLNLARNAHGR